MPQIIQRGTIPSPPKPWWQEGVWRCEHCGCHFMLDETDQADTNEILPPGYARRVSYPCPTCHQTVVRTEPGKPVQRRPIGEPAWWVEPPPRRVIYDGPRDDILGG